MTFDLGNTIHCCKDCTDRKVGCHTTCERYIKEREEAFIRKGEVYKARCQNMNIQKATMDRIKRMKTRKASNYGKK